MYYIRRRADRPTDLVCGAPGDHPLDRQPTIARGGTSLLAVALLVWLSPTPPALGSAVDLYGYGARDQAMAGATATTTGGHAAVYANPAGLAFGTGPSFGLAFQRGDFFLQIDGQDRDILESPALSLGLALPIPFEGWLYNRLALAVAFVIPATSILIADIPRPGDPSFILLENRAQTLSLQGALAFRPVEWLSVGAGFIALASLDGAVDVAPNETGRLGSEVRDELVADFALVAGITVAPFDWLSAAATYRGESRADFSFPVTAELGDDFPLPVPELEIQGTAQYDPEQVHMELSGRPVPALLLAAAVRWKRWSQFDNPIVYTATPEGYPEQPAPGFRDTVAFRFGAEGDLCAGDWRFQPRLGVGWEPTPAPAAAGFHNYLDNDRVMSTAGLGVAYDVLRLDIALQWHHLLPRKAGKMPHLLVGPNVGPGYPTIAHDGDMTFWSIELGMVL